MFTKSVFGDIFVGVQWIGAFIVIMRALGFVLNCLHGILQMVE